MFFLRKSSLERLPVVMSGVRMGERALQIGVDDPTLVGSIAAKVGLSGHAAIVVGQEPHAATARAAAAKSGALADVQVASLEGLPFDDNAFDVVVVHAAGLDPLGGPAGVALLRDGLRVLRSGGRIVIIEGSGGGLIRKLRPSSLEDAGGILSALDTAGFKATRVLGEREGYRFLEGLKREP
jgi:SAM-dependent methyltransferase